MITFPVDAFILSTYAVQTAHGTAIYYTRGRDGSQDYDLYKVLDVPQPT